MVSQKVSLSLFYFGGKISIMSLELHHISSTLVWRNERDSSPRFCQPLLIEFAKKDQKEVVKHTNKI